MNKITIEDFLNTEYSQSALYSSFRSIASYVDGLKPSSRKIVYTIKKRNIKSDMKVSRLASAVAEETEYLHGETSLQGVICNMAQNYVGANNDNLLFPSGSFGTRFVPTPSAARYIFTRQSESFNKYFSDKDDAVLIEQEFEGSIIEPKFFVPILPLLLINGSEGIGTGFAQKILPRDTKKIKGFITDYLTSKSSRVTLEPFYEGYNGNIYKDPEGSSWIIEGLFEIKNSTTIEITEVPIGYTLSSYLGQLETLIEKKIIKGYEDKSEEDKFNFIVDVPREFTKYSKDKIFDLLKLRKRVSENLTCVDENNMIREFDSIEEILKAYINIRLEYYLKRKNWILQNLQKEIDELDSKALFIEKVIKGEIIVNNKPKKDIEKQIETFPKIKKLNDNYDYLLRMPIYSLTKEKFEELKNQVIKKKEEINILKVKSEKELWIEDLK